MERDNAALDLAGQFYVLNEYLRGDREGASAVQRLVDLAVATIPECDCAGVTAWDERRGARGLASSGPTTAVVDEIQHTLDEGPCVTAAVRTDLEFVRIDDIETERRWPKFCAEVAERTPVRSVLSFHLSEAPNIRTALNLYAHRPQLLADHVSSVGGLFAVHARALMLHSASADQVSNLSDALVSSRQIGTAIGVLMALHKVSSDRAFEMLSAASQDLNRKLRDVADEVARTGVLPDRR